MLPELSSGQVAGLQRLEELLRDRAVALGLVAGSDTHRLGERHVRDSLRAASLLRPADAVVCDIGSGAGLPGLPIAIARPDLEVKLVEPRHRAVAFLELAIARLELSNAEVLPARVEEVEVTADVATTRAFGALQRSWEAALRVLRPGGRLIYFAGEGLEDPAGAARGIRAPEVAEEVEVERVIADSSPLVIMTRASP